MNASTSKGEVFAKEELVLPDRIELFRCSLSSLKDQGFFEPLARVVCQCKDPS